MKRTRGERVGFTLVELLVVIAIIAIIAGLVVPGLMNAQRRALVSQCMNNLRGIHQIAFLYSQKKHAFPLAKGVKEPRAHESLNVLLKSAEGEDLEPELFFCPESDFITPTADPDAPSPGFILDADTLSYTWVKERVRATKKASLSCDKYAGGMDYGDGEEHAGHRRAILIVTTNGQVKEIDLGDEEAISSYKIDNDYLPEGLTR